ncbi:phosphohistidine phosphatase SixA [Psychromonas sp. MB-3u-54]|uniref:phosphohistidine phosphatase SixA n=1 Tax=Psychromonas sp. MB-3u-54 TaxID=2058319 RepID=UPI000C341B15|nr:phosphohistidine phosphatase SixA [Psychromonas sp. MB-3u-54]PKH03762.1 phosphohistidine phosphatase SixA [Psychromonas sp. MB-3u-54]
MHIYIMRHGEAEMLAHSDSERALTGLGRLESEMMARYLADQNISFDAVLVSPYLRAQQTWQSVFPFFSAVANVQTLPFLTPGGSARKSVDEILALQAAGVQKLLIVSHLPLVGYIVGELVPEAGVPVFSTSSVGIVELDEDGFGKFQSLTNVAQLSDQ